MKEQLIKEKRLLDFYKKMVSLSQRNLHSSEKFLDEAFTIMMMGHEFGNGRLCQRRVYEILMIWNLSYNSFVDEKNIVTDIENIIYPFSIVDDSDYYRRIVTEEHLLLREIFFNCRLADEIENNRDDSIAFNLLMLKNSSCIEAFNKVVKLKEIARTGWVKRRVKKEYIESDATHIMQMIGLASAYFSLFKPSDLDYDKVMEMIIIHEMGEVLAGDIPEGDLLHESKHDIEAQGVREVFNGLSSGDYFINLWEEFESRESNEARFVYELDKFDPIVKAEYLDEVLGRTDLLSDFYMYEENRGTFDEGKLKKVFKHLGEKVNR